LMTELSSSSDIAHQAMGTFHKALYSFRRLRTVTRRPPWYHWTDVDILLRNSHSKASTRNEARFSWQVYSS
jgi:hypothetical protein